MHKPFELSPNALLKPISSYIVEDLSIADIHTTATLAATILGDLAVSMKELLVGPREAGDGINGEFFPDPDDESTPGTLIFWPTTCASRKTPRDDAHSAQYSLRASVFLSERDDFGAVYPAGFTLVLQLEESACGLIKALPNAVFEQLEAQIKGLSLPAGFAFLDDSQHLPVLPDIRRQLTKAIARAHEVTTKSRCKAFEAVMLHYIWDETEPEQHFGTVLVTLASLFMALHCQARQ